MLAAHIVNYGLLEKVNQILIYKYGMPERNKKLPNPIDMTIATILSQNTNDKNSYKAFTSLKDSFNTWEEAEKVKATVIEKIIKPAGLAKQKSHAIKNLLTNLVKTKGSISLKYLEKMNETEAINDLKKMKGIGVKTASCVLLFSLNRNVCPVDTHVHRTLNRIGLVQTSSPDKTFDAINKNLPKGIAHSFHTNLIKLGREICRPKKPACAACPVIEVCMYSHKNFDKISSYKTNRFMLLDNVNTK